MKGLIIYKGRYGATRQYAEWLSNTLRIPAASEKEVSGSLDEYDFLVIGSSVYIGKLEIRSWLKKRIPELLKKKIFFFQVSGTAPDEKEKLETYLGTGFPFEIRARIEAFFLPGRLNISRLSWLDKMMLRMGARMAKDPEDRKNMLTEYDQVSRNHLDELIKSIQDYLQKTETADPVESKASTH